MSNRILLLSVGHSPSARLLGTIINLVAGRQMQELTAPITRISLETLPAYIPLIFGLSTFLTIGIFYKAARQFRFVLFTLLSWIILQAIVARSGFYTVTDTLPPRIIFLVLPPLLFIAGLFLTTKGKRFLDRLDIKYLTLLHIVRIPVEMVLFWLFLHKTVPQLMTFEGRNFDILSGLTAPLIFYFGFIKKQFSTRIILVWNLLCLGLLLNIVFHGILSAPLPIQQFAFDQPNIALLHFPFIWLPGCIVPLVLLSHLASIRQLLRRNA